MAIDVEKYQNLKKKADELKSAVLRAEGSLANLMDALKKHFNVSSLEEAETLLESLTKERDETEALFNRKLTEFNEKWEALENG